MSLVLTVHGAETIWMLADRHLSFGAALPPADDAMKVLCLEAADGIALLGYAGLGATAGGAGPSEWMSAALRGRRRSISGYLRLLQAVAERELLPHMRRMPGDGPWSNSIIAAAFENGVARRYSINFSLAGKAAATSAHWFQHMRVRSSAAAIRRIGLFGRGAEYLRRDTSWIRPLLRLVSVHDRGRAATERVANYLAALHFEANQGASTGASGLRCCVAWHRRGTGSARETGGCACYNGISRDVFDEPLPTIANGFDLAALASDGAAAVPQAAYATVPDGFPRESECDALYGLVTANADDAGSLPFGW